MLNLSCGKVSDGCEVGVRMGEHIHSLARSQYRRARMVEKNERSDPLLSSVGQQAPHREAPEIFLAAGNDHRNSVNFSHAAHPS